jgi:TPR repeat protein
MYSKAYCLFHVAAKMGHSAAQCRLGVCYYRGEGVSKNYPEAVKWFQKAVDSGISMAYFHLGCCYYFGKGVDRDQTKAFLMFHDAALKGDALATYCVGKCYYIGHGPTKDYKLATQWYQKAADMELTDAQISLGHCFRKGEGVPWSFQLFSEWLNKAASTRKNQLQEIYDRFEKHAKHLAFNDRNGKEDSTNELGRCYFYGEGVEKNYEKAFDLFMTAAEKDSVDAQFNVGNCYFHGHGTKVDKTKAVEWYEKAAESGHPGALNMIGECYYNGEGVEQSYGNAFFSYLKAAQNGEPNAQINVGTCYFRGEGTFRNTIRAEEWYRKASAHKEVIRDFLYGNDVQLGHRDNASSASRIQEIEFMDHSGYFVYCNKGHNVYVIDPWNKSTVYVLDRSRNQFVFDAGERNQGLVLFKVHETYKSLATRVFSLEYGPPFICKYKECSKTGGQVIITDNGALTLSSFFEFNYHGVIYRWKNTGTRNSMKLVLKDHPEKVIAGLESPAIPRTDHMCQLRILSNYSVMREVIVASCCLAFNNYL